MRGAGRRRTFCGARRGRPEAAAGLGAGAAPSGEASAVPPARARAGTAKSWQGEKTPRRTAVLPPGLCPDPSVFGQPRVAPRGVPLTGCGNAPLLVGVDPAVSSDAGL